MNPMSKKPRALPCELISDGLNDSYTNLATEILPVLVSQSWTSTCDSKPNRVLMVSRTSRPIKKNLFFLYSFSFLVNSA